MTTHDTSRLPDYVDDDLAPAERDAVARHLASCAACAAEVEALRDLKARASGLPSDRPLAGDPWPAILARIESGSPSADRGRVLPWRVTLSLPQLAAAAALLLAVGMG
ncbi:MAG TPA: zf-HC2 domain-containing protein, partial [Vicinamibacterales bacterium]|nr:zf-HC2 domain-containing protein [Vicinamibacterales bacterium]